MKQKRILYLGNIDAIHDFKWSGFFSIQEEYEVFFLDVGGNRLERNNYLFNLYTKAKIHFLEPLKIAPVSRPDKLWKNYKHIKKFVTEHDIQIIHSLSVTTTSIFLLWLKRPYIITTRGSDILVEISKMKERGDKGKLVDKWIFNLFKKLFQRASTVTSTSLKQIERIEQIMQCSSQLIRTGLDFSWMENITCKDFFPKELEGKKYVFSPRLIRPIYNIELQVEALKLLNKKILEEYDFVFIQFKEKGPEYLKMIKDGLHEIPGLRYHIYNNISQEQMFCLFKNASLAVMTPKSDGTPNSALEAMALKCPLIVGNLDYDRDLFDGFCLKLQEDNSENLVENIQSALTNYPKEMLEKAYQNVKEKGNRNIEMGKLQKIYEAILS